MKQTGSIIAAAGLMGLFMLGTAEVSNAADEFQYAGSKKCVGCHRIQNEAWKQDYHAKALDDLKPGTKGEAKAKAKLDPTKDYTKDPACLACHSTGFGKPAVAGADLVNVSCESCHGPGGQYKNIKIMNKKKYQENREAQHKLAIEAGLREPNEQLCVECHNQESPTWKGFDYKKMIEEVKHKK